MRISPSTGADQRRHLSSLGRHLQRSVLATSMPIESLRRLVPSAGGGEHVLVNAACALAATAGTAADALDDALNALHQAAIARIEGEADYDALRSFWIGAAGSAAMPGAYWALITHPLADRTLRHLAFGDVEMLRQAADPEPRLDTLLERRSVAPRRLGRPAPAPHQIDLVIQAVLAAPDHGRLRPWRVIEFGADSREALADLFVREKRRRDPLARASDLRKAREHALQPPCLLGFGAIVLSGDRCFDPVVAAELRLLEGEFLAGFVSIGSVLETPPEASRPLAHDAWTCWTPAPQMYATAPTGDSR